MNLKYIDREKCHGCGCPNPKYWAFASQVRDSISVKSACHACAMVDQAMEEADSLELRYTEIAVGTADEYSTYYNGNRCLCGAVGLVNFSKIKCVRCWKEESMLGKQIAEHKLFSRLLTDLRRTIREVKKCEPEKTT